MEGDHIKIWHVLCPLAWLYGLGVTVRNILFECGVLKSESFDIPVISVGNITAGGTGKTPHTEYLIRLLSPHHQVAILSRGYKRRSRGYRLATLATPMSDIGDEPYQMKHKFPGIHMAVDRDRRHGIRQLCAPDVRPEAEVVILDDAYQHRYVLPGVNMLLMDYHRLIYFDELLPAGRLREPRSSSQRADVVIVTKCPPYITPMEQHGIARSLGMQPWQKLFYTRFVYGAPLRLSTILGRSRSDEFRPAAEDTAPTLEQFGATHRPLVLLTGIASPEQMEYDLRKVCDFTPVHFADHHAFTPADMTAVRAVITRLAAGGQRVSVLTTEKDASRLLAYIRTHGGATDFLSPVTAADIYVLPVEVEFMNGRATEFNQYILGYVQKNSRNSTLLKRANAHKA